MEWIYKGIVSSVPTDGAAARRTNETYEAEFRQWWNSNIYQKFLSMSSIWCHGDFLPFSGRIQQGCFEIADSRLCTG